MHLKKSFNIFDKQLYPKWTNAISKLETRALREFGCKSHSASVSLARSWISGFHRAVPKILRRFILLIIVLD